ncbi:hypothetical protein D9X30_1724 [Cupriavidus sp. U2]|uniref:sugar phosphate isomerase/epimerase family protein n=1 Tax=Cupriavidus sp. U2 TaxID=2920269 RepID=UPI001ECC0FB7|nr:sugar phosphate isomerase/epimerase family protein [Cupriavidus sp. U2]KAI3593286.1 hypothetical protein D9X30_1724 [Cupriavidus sp. U2]
MRIAISNIAWNVDEDAAVQTLLHRFAVDAIDIAPGKYFPDPDNVKDCDVRVVRDKWIAAGIEITGMQSLLFNSVGLNLFGDAASRGAMLKRLSSVARIGSLLGATRLVFGSPRNRDRGALSNAAAWEMAVPFFAELGDIASSHGVMFCLEPTPSCYGSNFMTNCEETATVVRAVNHPSIRMQFDTGALTINGESPFEMLARHGELIGHVHVSEPLLVPIGDGGTDHEAMARALSTAMPEQQLVSIEMVATTDEAPLDAVRRAVAATKLWYGPSHRSSPA